MRWRIGEEVLERQKGSAWFSLPCLAKMLTVYYCMFKYLLSHVFKIFHICFLFHPLSLSPLFPLIYALFNTNNAHLYWLSVCVWKHIRETAKLQLTLIVMDKQKGIPHLPHYECCWRISGYNERTWSVRSLWLWSCNTMTMLRWTQSPDNYNVFEIFNTYSYINIITIITSKAKAKLTHLQRQLNTTR